VLALVTVVFLLLVHMPLVTAVMEQIKMLDILVDLVEERLADKCKLLAAAVEVMVVPVVRAAQAILVMDLQDLTVQQVIILPALMVPELEVAVALELILHLHVDHMAPPVVL
jgi:hypothetical protein